MADGGEELGFGRGCTFRFLPRVIQCLLLFFEEGDIGNHRIPLHGASLVISIIVRLLHIIWFGRFGAGCIRAMGYLAAELNPLSFASRELHLLLALPMSRRQGLDNDAL